MNKKRSRREHKKRNSRQNLSKTKRRQSSNKKGALKGIHNNKTKANKLRRIVQRGGGNRDELNVQITSNDVVQVSNYIRDAIYPLLFQQFIDNSTQPPGNSALYTACRSTNPNIDIVKTLLFFGFKPDTPNNNENGSYPQHGVVAAAKVIIESTLDDVEKLRRLNVLKDILEELNRAGANMSLKNRLKNGAEYTAYTEYSDMFGQEPTPSIEDNISRFNADLSSRIKELLRPLPGPPPGPPPGYGPPAHAMGYGAPLPGYGAPPHAMGYGAPPPGYSAPPPGYSAPPHAMGYGAPLPGYSAPSHAMVYGAPPHGYVSPPHGYVSPPHVHIVTGKASSLYPEFYSKFKGEPIKLPNLPDSSNYQPSENGNSYFTYKGVSYYFSHHIQNLIDKNKTTTITRSGVGSFIFTYGENTYHFFIPVHNVTLTNQPSAYVSFQVDRGNWVQDAPLTLVKKK